MMDITQPDNPADITVIIRMSGNRLVSVLNTVQALMYQTGKLDLPWYAELNEVVERMRDQLSDERTRPERQAAYLAFAAALNQ